MITLPTSDYRQKAADLLELLESKLRRGRIDSISESDDQSVISYSVSGLDKDKLLDLRQQLGKIAERASVNLFFHHSGWF